MLVINEQICPIWSAKWLGVFVPECRSKNTVVVCRKGRNGSIPIFFAHFPVFCVNGISDGQFIPCVCRHVAAVDQNIIGHDTHPPDLDIF